MPDSRDRIGVAGAGSRGYDPISAEHEDQQREAAELECADQDVAGDLSHAEHSSNFHQRRTQAF